jgi:ketosteroid isomerase-like protein
MPISPTAADVARRFYERLNANDIDGCAELWADDARIVVPYPPDGFPGEIAGKETIVAGFHDLFGVYRRFVAELLDVWPGQDPNVAIVRYRPHAELVARLFADHILEHHHAATVYH